MPPKKQRRRKDNDVALHRPKRILPHLADEYDELDNPRVAAELRRHLCGHSRRFVDVANADPRPERRPPRADPVVAEALTQIVLESVAA